MCTVVLNGWDPATLPINSHLDSYSRALLVSQDITSSCDPLGSHYQSSESKFRTFSADQQRYTKVYIEVKSTIWIRISRVSDPDPDPHGSELIWAVGSGSGSRREKITQKNRKKDRIFIFWSAGCSLLRAEDFSCSLGVIYGGLGISKLQFLIKKIKI